MTHDELFNCFNDGGKTPFHCAVTDYNFETALAIADADTKFYPQENSGEDIQIRRWRKTKNGVEFQNFLSAEVYVAF